MSLINLKQLTNYQLYDIIQDQKLDKQQRVAANEEFTARRLTTKEIEEVIHQHDLSFQPPKQARLSLIYKIIALTIPFIWIVHILMTSRYLATGQKRKWREYWLFFCIGLLLWTIVFIIIGKNMNR